MTLHGLVQIDHHQALFLIILLHAVLINGIGLHIVIGNVIFRQLGTVTHLRHLDLCICRDIINAAVALHIDVRLLLPIGKTQNLHHPL